MKLLTAAINNTKIAKNKGKGYLSYILHLAPYNLSGVNVCPAASTGCAKACLNTAGRGQINSVQAARIKKTQWLINDKQSFMNQLIKDLDAVVRKSKRLNLMPVVRLNGTSDIDWFSIIMMYPEIQFYDYTKRLALLKKHKISGLTNYSLTFSRSESNEPECREALKLWYNVAVVFKTEDLPSEFMGYKVIDGDNDDLRFLDPKGPVIVGLKAKGKAKKDTSGFVVDGHESQQAECRKKTG